MSEWGCCVEADGLGSGYTGGGGAETERKKQPERERKQKRSMNQRETRKRQNESWREAGNRRGRETEVYRVKTEQEVLVWHC